LWVINGSKLVELHRDWAVIERSEDRSRHVHHRRSPRAANIACCHGVRALCGLIRPRTIVAVTNVGLNWRKPMRKFHKIPAAVRESACDVGSVH
jgi:hypothetical protein